MCTASEGLHGLNNRHASTNGGHVGGLKMEKEERCRAALFALLFSLDYIKHRSHRGDGCKLWL